MNILLDGGIWALKIWVIATVALFVWLTVYIYVWSDKAEYKKAKREIFEYVKARKQRCKGSNRFVITVEVLQEVFPEFETKIIEKVWVALVNERVIQQDPLDNEWCLR